MAGIKIGDLPELNEAPTSNDYLVVVDTNVDTTKKLSVNNLIQTASAFDTAEALVLIAGGVENVVPATNNSYDLGSAAKKFKDAHVAGTVYAGSIVSPSLIDSAAIITLINDTVTGGAQSSSVDSAAIITLINDTIDSDYIASVFATYEGGDIAATLASGVDKIVLGNGTNTAPSLSFTSSAGTGIYTTANKNTVNFTSDGNLTAWLGDAGGSLSSFFQMSRGGTPGALLSLGASGFEVVNNAVSTELFIFNNNDNASPIRFYSSTNIAGAIELTSSNSVSYLTSSDYRLKENITPLENAINTVMEIPVYTFNFNGSPDRTVHGFLAHEVQEHVPEAVSGEKDQVDVDGNPVYQGIDQSKLVPLLLQAVKELKQEIDLLKASL